MYLFDTNHCSELLKGDKELVAKVNLSSVQTFATSSVVCGELFYMAELSKYREENLKSVKALISTMRVFDIDKHTGEIYGLLKSSYIKHFGPKPKLERSRYKIHELGITDNDLWIASNAIQHNLVLLTADRDFERVQEISDLEIDCWL